MEKFSSSFKVVAFLAFFMLLVSAPSVLGRVSSDAAMRAEVMKEIVQDLAKEELMNAYIKQGIEATTSSTNSRLEQVVEQKPLKCKLVGFPCKQNSDCCFGLTCRYVPAPLYNTCSLI